MNIVNIKARGAPAPDGPALGGAPPPPAPPPHTPLSGQAGIFRQALVSGREGGQYPRERWDPYSNTRVGARCEVPSNQSQEHDDLDKVKEIIQQIGPHLIAHF